MDKNILGKFLLYGYFSKIDTEMISTINHRYQHLQFKVAKLCMLVLIGADDTLRYFSYFQEIGTSKPLSHQGPKFVKH